jgi:hypothetical protein
MKMNQWSNAINRYGGWGGRRGARGRLGMQR